MAYVTQQICDRCTSNQGVCKCLLTLGADTEVVAMALCAKHRRQLRRRVAKFIAPRAPKVRKPKGPEPVPDVPGQLKMEGVM